MKINSMIVLFIVFSSFFFHSHVFSYDDDNPDFLFSLSLEDLMKVELKTGSLFSVTSKESPSAITVITKADIERSGAKKLAHVLEQHVAGMILMTHSEGEKIGVRGHIAAENYKLLLLVNGKNVTNMVYEGVITEIDQWELGDIDRVEVISGPGSVTYGTGAIAGVINIITKTSRSDIPTWSVGLSRNDTYQSNGVNLQYSSGFEDWGVYGFVSYRETDGLDSPDYYRPNANEPSDNRYIGKGENSSIRPQEYQADSFGRPQIKAHINLNYGENFTAWIRFTQSGQTHGFNTKTYRTDENGNPTTYANYRNIQTGSFVASADYRYEFENQSSILTSLTFDSQEYIRGRPVNTQYNEGHINNVRQYAFSQDRITPRILYDFQPVKDLNIIAGYEYSQISVLAPWGKNIDHIWIKEGVEMLSRFDSSIYLQDLTLNGRPDINNSVELGDGIKTATHSQLLESKYKVSDDQTFFYAHRVDFPDLSDSMFSPRLSLVSNINDNNTLVTTLQRAQRLMPIRAQYLSDKAGNDSKHETLDSIELSYTHNRTEHTSLNFKSYYNKTQAVGFTGEKLEFLTDFDLFGLEFNATYKHKNIEMSFNHAYIKPLNMEMNDELKTGQFRNNITFSDYYFKVNSAIPLILEDYGNGLNNWPENISKFLFSQSFMDQRLRANLNVQIYWDYKGAYDEMGMYQQAYNNIDRSSLPLVEQLLFDDLYQDFQHERQLLENEDAFEIDYNINVSLTYLWKRNNSTEVKLKLFVENIADSSKRYYVSTGSSNAYPSRLSFMEKPVMFGLSVQVNFH